MMFIIPLLGHHPDSWEHVLLLKLSFVAFMNQLDV